MLPDRARQFQGRTESYPLKIRPGRDTIIPMMTAEQLRQRINEHPFWLFRLTLSDGRAFDVPNHDVALVKKNTIEIGTNLDADSWAQKYVECAILHITSIEDTSASKAA